MLSESVKKQIENVLNQNEVVLFMKGTKMTPRCGFSAMVVEILDKLSAIYKDVDVLADPAVREGIKEYGQWPTIPQLYVRGNLIGGCDIVRELYQTGELAKLLGTAQPQPRVEAQVQTQPSLQTSSSQVKQMAVKELKRRLDAKEPLKLYDVRTDAERQVAKLEESTWFDEKARTSLALLPRDTMLVFHCHHGGRSQAAAEGCIRQGFTNVWNVQGGIDAWSQEIDPSVRRY